MEWKNLRDKKNALDEQMYKNVINKEKYNKNNDNLEQEIESVCGKMFDILWKQVGLNTFKENLMADDEEKDEDEEKNCRGWFSCLKGGATKKKKKRKSRKKKTRKKKTRKKTRKKRKRKRRKRKKKKRRSRK